MSGEIIVVYGAQKTLESNGPAVPNGTIALADDAIYDIYADGNGFPDAEFVANLTFAIAPVEGTIIYLFARPLDVDGTLDTEVSEISRPTIIIGVFSANNVTTLQTVIISGGFVRDVPAKAEYYLVANNGGQQISEGWTLKVRPRSYKAAA